ncbi:hypothetical protein HAX54_007955, partial [Datura stramonium]|nr:hypothetical protein [Datura stramonium]
MHVGRNREWTRKRARKWPRKAWIKGAPQWSRVMLHRRCILPRMVKTSKIPEE